MAGNGAECLADLARKLPNLILMTSNFQEKTVWPY
jgi:hypothetical protein